MTNQCWTHSGRRKSNALTSSNAPAIELIKNSHSHSSKEWYIILNIVWLMAVRIISNILACSWTLRQSECAERCVRLCVTHAAALRVRFESAGFSMPTLRMRRNINTRPTVRYDRNDEKTNAEWKGNSSRKEARAGERETPSGVPPYIVQRHSQRISHTTPYPHIYNILELWLHRLLLRSSSVCFRFCWRHIAQIYQYVRVRLIPANDQPRYGVNETEHSWYFSLAMHAHTLCDSLCRKRFEFLILRGLLFFGKLIAASQRHWIASALTDVKKFPTTTILHL